MDFYSAPASPACRAVQLTAKALGVSLNKKFIDIRAEQHKAADYTKINPCQSVPTLIDGDLTLWEGGAIQIYLATKYPGDGSLYPSDPVEQAKLNRVLFFTYGRLLPRFAAFQVPVMRDGQAPDPKKKEKLRELVKLVDKMLGSKQYVMGNHITIGDHALAALICTFKECGADLTQTPNVLAWLDRCAKNMPGYESENLDGARKLGEFIKSKTGRA